MALLQRLAQMLLLRRRARPGADSIRFSWPSLCWTSLAVSTSRALMRSRSAAILSRSACSSLLSGAPWPPAGCGRSRGACGPRPGSRLPCAAASSGNAAVQAAAMQPAGQGPRRVRYVLGQSALDAMHAERSGRSESPSIRTMPQFSIKDHANCGMDELACAATVRGVAESRPAVHRLPTIPPTVRAKRAEAHADCPCTI